MVKKSVIVFPGGTLSVDGFEKLEAVKSLRDPADTLCVGVIFEQLKGNGDRTKFAHALKCLSESGLPESQQAAQVVAGDLNIT